MTLSRIITGNQDLQHIQDNVSKALDPLQSSPFVGCILIQGVSVTTSGVSVSHGLGYVPRFFIVAGNTANTTVYSYQASTAQFLFLKAGSTNTTVNLIVN